MPVSYYVCQKEMLSTFFQPCQVHIAHFSMNQTSVGKTIKQL